MNKIRKRRHWVEHDNVDRWLVSYADYMTLLFALFVVLYAMAMVNEEPFESVTESIGRVFQANDELPKNRGHGDDVLTVNTSKTKKQLYGNSIQEDGSVDILDHEGTLSNVSDNKVGTNLNSLEKELHTALYPLIESGYAQLQIDGDWLEIELNSGLLFPSGSSSITDSAADILAVIYNVIGAPSNFIRIRGYTDDQPINTEIIASNWELSVFRATAVLKVLENLSLDPARMAIEGYGQYYPREKNNTRQGRAQNRRVVIAISKYGLEKTNLLVTPTISIEDVEAIKTFADEDNEEIKIIRLENGGIRITTREDDSIEKKDNK